MPLTGNDAELRRLISSLGDAGNRILPRATEAAGAEAENQYQAEFAGTRDPWGAPWSPPRTGGRPNFRTGALASPRVTTTRDTVRIKLERYWIYPQMGANEAPQNAVLPFSPSNWDRPIQAVVEGVVIATFPR